jgi:hypothetical protein
LPPREEYCDLAFQGTYGLDDGELIVLEDYACVVSRAQGAEAVRGADRKVSAVRLRGTTGPPSEAAVRDVEDFARDLAARGGGSGLGWA